MDRKDPFRTDIRRIRADKMVAAILHKIEPYLAEDAQMNDVVDELLGLFLAEGVDVITDADRAQAGLPARGPDGWTVEELLALERVRLEVLQKPLQMIIPQTQK